MTTSERIKMEKNIGRPVRILYKDYTTVEDLVFLPEMLTKNGTKSKWYIIPMNGKVGHLKKDGKRYLESAHKFNYIGMIDCSKIKHIEWLSENENS